MEAKDTKVLVLDIDGTLTNSQKEITPKTKEAITEIMEKGHKVILASGRPTPGMRRYEKELNLPNYDGYLLSFNGGRIINCATKEVVYQRILPPEVIAPLYEYACKNDLGLISYDQEVILVARRMDEYIELESRINAMECKMIDDFVSYIDFDVNKCLMTAPPEKAEKVVEELNEMFGDILSIYRSEPFFIEIMPKNVDKAQSLDQMLPKVGLLRENTICCGDGFNDMSMIQYAAVGVAMENAQPEVKEAADFITKSNDEDGLVDVIEKFIK